MCPVIGIAGTSGSGPFFGSLDAEVEFLRFGELFNVVFGRSPITVGERILIAVAVPDNADTYSRCRQEATRF